jgi:7 transmembrane helices usually fused to an inactive transglutaminase
VFVVVRAEPVRQIAVDHPETLGLVAAAQLLLGRYTGYRLLELYRFRDLAEEGVGKT